MCTGGRSRSSHRGSHQLAWPSSTIVAGTSTIRTSVASMSTATARPNPIIFTVVLSFSRNARNTAIITSAAEVMTRAVERIPTATLSTVSRSTRYSSRTRERRNTS
ncbi:MAG: hypothetical protein KatS3mg014_0566 [Actinomycetota bacterium]|nr:MAG: hypothetical protein KatS3mg014_0566 [Actinomycetota bacterium]